ncbi:MAG: carboxylating nicotinate-nucleotide diphosphorylase [Promethearchaeota archaeon]|nr:MAG: carboxylating nicotinate-nucleotide diphosphorylase [Candidatus Lokiarchaeota archaeon]
MSYNKIILEKKLKAYLEEDCQFTDVSSSFIPEDAVSSAKILAKSAGYISGLVELEILFESLEVEIQIKKNDGDAVEEGDIIAELNGKTRKILIGERMGLNLLTHMSAITSMTRKFVNIVRDSGKNIKIAATRKTTPGLRIFEKRAVELGGGDTHRFSLDDMILLKDTHLRFYNGEVERLLKDVKKKASFSKKIEIEIERIEDVLVAAENGADIIMLDNMNPDQIEDALALLKQHNLRDKVIIEISGGMNLENIVDYIIAEPDVISTSEITQFPTEKVDLSLRFD